MQPYVRVDMKRVHVMCCAYQYDRWKRKEDSAQVANQRQMTVGECRIYCMRRGRIRRGGNFSPIVRSKV